MPQVRFDAVPSEAPALVAALQASFAQQRHAYAALAADFLASREGALSDASVSNCRLGSLDLGFSNKDLQELLGHRVELASLSSLLAQLGSGDARRITALLQGQLLPSDKLLCYTDGSFRGPKPGDAGHLGWACAFFRADIPGSTFFDSCLGVASGGPLPYVFETADPPCAFTAECMALCFAALIAMTRFADEEVIFLADCTSALAIAAGHCAGAAQGAPGALYGMHALLRFGTATPAWYQYVPAHQDLPVMSSWTLPPNSAMSLAILTYLGAISFFAMEAGCFHGLLPSASVPLAMFPYPALMDARLGTTGLSAEQILAPFHSRLSVPYPLEGSSDGCGSPGPALEQLSLRVASYKVLSLNAPPDAGRREAPVGLAFKAARPAILADSLLKHGVQVASIQETRCPAGMVRTGAFIRFCSGSINGNFGTELWLRAGFCGSLGNGRTLRFEPDQFVVHHSDPRRILVSTLQCGLRIAFVCLHAPHRACEGHAVDSWWAETTALCRSLFHQSLVILAGDMNAAVGDVVSEHVSDHDCEPEDLSGGHLHSLLRELRAWLPATFAHVHSGPSWAFQQIRNGKCGRLDYVAVPLEWSSSEFHTWVEAGIHACQVHADHFATVLQLHVKFLQQSSHDPAGRRRYVCRPRLNEAAMSSDQGREQVAAILESVPDVPWHVSAHAHASIVVDYLQSRLAEAFPLPKVRQRHPYLTPPTMQLRSAVAKLRRACYACNHRLRRHTMFAAWESWRSHGAVSFLQRFDVPWVHMAWKSSAQQGHAMQLAARQLRAACGEDRAKYLERLAVEASSGNSRDAFAAVRRLLGQKRRKPFAPEVLPSLRDLDGNMCASADAIATRWRQHFSTLEAGVDSSVEDILAVAIEEGQAEWALPDSVDLMPSARDLARALAKAPTRKAVGPDGIPNGVGRAQPFLMAHRLFRASAGRFKRMLKGAARLERHRLECLDHLSSLHRALRDLAEGACLLPPTQEWDEAREACLLCRLAFTSRLSCASHAARLHGYRRAATMLATGTTCRGCGKVYSSQGRLRRHVNYSAPCRQLGSSTKASVG